MHSHIGRTCTISLLSEPSNVNLASPSEQFYSHIGCTCKACLSVDSPCYCYKVQRIKLFICATIFNCPQPRFPLNSLIICNTNYSIFKTFTFQYKLCDAFLSFNWHFVDLEIDKNIDETDDLFYLVSLLSLPKHYCFSLLSTNICESRL